jgi:hypothetical protein
LKSLQVIILLFKNAISGDSQNQFLADNFLELILGPILWHIADSYFSLQTNFSDMPRHDLVFHLHLPGLSRKKRMDGRRGDRSWFSILQVSQLIENQMQQRFPVLSFSSMDRESVVYRASLRSQFPSLKASLLWELRLEMSPD